MAAHPDIVKRCVKCDKPISPRNTTGYCTRHHYYYKKAKADRRCTDCGKPICHQSKSGYCKSCVQRHIPTPFECRDCGAGIRACNKSGYCVECRARRRLELNPVKYQSRKPSNEVKIEAKRMVVAPTHTFTCRYPACGKTFRTSNPYQRYCDNECRQKHRLTNDWQMYHNQIAVYRVSQPDSGVSGSAVYEAGDVVRGW